MNSFLIYLSIRLVIGTTIKIVKMKGGDKIAVVSTFSQIKDQETKNQNCQLG
jgi:hypothetical protein